MVITYQFECDWDQDDFICRDARPADAPNLFQGAARIDHLKRQAVGGSVSAVFSPLSANPYGLAYLEWTTGTLLHIGFDGSLYDVDLSAGESVGGVVWVYNTDAAYNAVPVTLQLRNQAGTVIASGSPEFIPEGIWVRLAVTGTTPGGTTSVYLTLSVSMSAVFHVSGAILVNGDAPPAFNTGSSSRYDNFTAFVQEAEWHVGCGAPFQYISDLEGAVITLFNADHEFSPENADSPLSGDFQPERRVLIYAMTSSMIFFRLMFSGWIHVIHPSFNGDRRCVIELTGTRRFVDGATVHVELLQNITAEQVAEAVIARIGLPRFYGIDYSGPPGEFDVIYPYAADNWRDGVDALNALTDVMKARQGKLIFDRAGIFGLWTPGQTPGAIIATLDHNMLSLDYRYGDRIFNDITVLSYRRTLSAAADVLLWDADEIITLDAGETLKIRARYKNENDGVTVGGVDVYLEITAPAGVTSFVEADARSALITLENANAVPASVTLLRLRGRRLTAYNEVEANASDADSIEEFGRLSEVIDSRLVNSRREARRIAGYRLGLFKQPQGIARRVTFLASDDPALEETVVDYGITWNTFYRVRLIADPHDRVYVLVGESHRLIAGGALHETTWILEPAAGIITLNDSIFGLIGEYKVGLT